MKDENGKGITLTLTSQLAQEFAHVVTGIDLMVSETAQLRAKRDAWKARCGQAENDRDSFRRVAGERGKLSHSRLLEINRLQEDRNTVLAEMVRMRTEVQSLRDVCEVNQRVAEENVELRKRLKESADGADGADKNGNG